MVLLHLCTNAIHQLCTRSSAWYHTTPRHVVQLYCAQLYCAQYSPTRSTQLHGTTGHVVHSTAQHVVHSCTVQPETYYTAAQYHPMRTTSTQLLSTTGHNYSPAQYTSTQLHDTDRHVLQLHGTDRHVLHSCMVIHNSPLHISPSICLRSSQRVL